MIQYFSKFINYSFQYNLCKSDFVLFLSNVFIPFNTTRCDLHALFSPPPFYFVFLHFVWYYLWLSYSYLIYIVWEENILLKIWPGICLLLLSSINLTSTFDQLYNNNKKNWDLQLYHIHKDMFLDLKRIFTLHYQLPYQVKRF